MKKAGIILLFPAIALMAAFPAAAAPDLEGSQYDASALAGKVRSLAKKTAESEGSRNGSDASAARQDKIDFAINLSDLESGERVYFYRLISKDDANSGSADEDGAFRRLLPLDVPGVWKKRTEGFFIMMTRNAYVVNKGISFFTKKRLLDVNYINETLPGMKVSRNADGTYALDGTPSATSTLDYYSKTDIANQPENSAIHYAASLDASRGTPDVMLVQHSYNFDDIMSVRTNKSSMVFSEHYGINADQTLVIAYSLSFIYNVPPFFFGGADRLRKEYVKALQQVAANIDGMKN